MSNSRRIDNNTFGDNATIHQGDINNVHNYPQERRETPPPLSQLIPFPRDPDFVNRGDMLDKISAHCLEPAGRVALVGLGGVGKSQLAIEFAHRFADKHKNIWVFWIHAATQERVQEGFRLIADAVKLPERKQPQADIPLLVKNWLSIEHNGRWIIILDSADETEVLYSASESVHDKRSLAAYIPKSRNGAIVLTTRNRSLASKLTGGHKHIIDVDTMSEADALTLLERKMGSPLLPSEASLAEDLVKALECIPLAIGQAAAYIQARRPRSSIEKYLAEFRKSERESVKLLKYEANDIGRDEETSNTVLRTWAISFDHIRSQQRSAADLLSLMSFFDRQGIPEWVLNHPTMQSNNLDETEKSESDAGEDSDNDISSSFEEDILVLRNYCLIAVNEEGNKFEMHRLVQLSIKSWLKAFGLQETFMQQYITRIAASFPTTKYENWAICRDLFAHVQVALDYRPNEDTLEDWVILCYKGGKYARRQGKYNLAEQMARKSKKVCEKKFGKDDALMLQSIWSLASIISEQGRWNEGEELHVQLVESYTAKFGADHPDTLRIMGDLAIIYWNQRRWDDAEELEVKVLEARKNTLGTDHPYTLHSMNSLASTYRKQGRLNEAEKLLVQVTEAYKNTLGIDHPYTLEGMQELESTYRNQGRWDEAEELGMQVVEARKNMFGADHPYTLQSMGNLALTYYKQGRWEEAEKLEVQVMKALKMNLGADHPDTLSGMNNLAITWKKQGVQHPVTLGSSKWLEIWSNDRE
ncbi:tetratricopeptide repeat domain-containing protein [Trichoderma breve]|uniref:Tetratricopeptide repeat domain-containing protein n=1 Tax=Trichoderma breve TaxID=2034170 RepID=A0A9W9E1D7_9HYPO|nr:tetratricopeptide repeat domain-containing protein [Trichoderma breve]KAJ4854193.1 tetratricopeptide repeat domain-containing protein [Trichoderma breve]